jgi:hypothetical protein
MQLLVNCLIEYLNDPDHPLIVWLLYLNSSGDSVAVIDVDSHLELNGRFRKQLYLLERVLRHAWIMNL